MDENQVRVMFVDDEPSVLKSLRRLCKLSLDAHCDFVESGAQALQLMAEKPYDVIVADMRMPDMQGDELLAKVAETYPDTVRLVLTGYADKDSIVRAVNQGRVWGFIVKPWENDDLIQSIRQAITHQQLVAEHALLRRSLAFYETSFKNGFDDFVGRSLPMQSLYSSIERSAPSNANVFINGASGTGKELAAKAIHHNSNRKDKAFVALNCAAIPTDLMESEIFGHVKGAFSGAVSNREGAATLADGGTLFLDEIAEMDINLQAKLLRFIQTGQFQKVGSSQTHTADIRFVSATNRPPLSAIEAGLMREDLYYRLCVIPLLMPSLKDRESDITLLANFFLERFSKSEAKEFVGFSQDAQTIMQNYQWPGNVRQLENIIHSLVVMNEGPMIAVEHLAFALQLSTEAVTELLHPNAPPDITAQLEPSLQAPESQPVAAAIVPLAEVERVAIEKAIDFCNGNVVRAAGKLEVSPSTLYRKMQNWQKEP